MKFTTVFAVLVTLATAVSATILDPVLDTNAKRFAQGLNPLPPVRRGKKPTPAWGGNHGYPSDISHGHGHGHGHGGPPPPPTCPHNEPVLCCDSVERADRSLRKELRQRYGILVASDVEVGFDCKPVNDIRGGCKRQEVCCEKDDDHGRVAIGCSPPKSSSHRW